MDRKTKSVTTPSGAVVEMKEFVSAGEFLDLSEENEKLGLSKNAFAQHLMETAVVSVNGSKEEVGARLRDLPLPDYTFLTKEVAKLVTGDFSEAKTQA